MGKYCYHSFYGIRLTKITLLFLKNIMWPFIQDKKTLALLSSDPQRKPKPMSFEEIVASMGDYSDLADRDAPVQFWLPEPAVKSLKQLCAIDGNSMNEALKQFLVIHCYGVYAFSVMKKTHPNLFKDVQVLENTRVLFSPKRHTDSEEDSGVYFSRKQSDPVIVVPPKKRETTYWVCELGKNISPIKVYISKRLRDDLKILAEHVDINLSQYLREIVISRLLGHGTLPVRPEMLASLPYKAADDWCENAPLPWVQVSYEEYSKAEIREVRE